MSEREAQAPVLSFSSAAQWEKWLAKNHSSSGGVWLKIGKKGAGKSSLSYSAALDVALCYGWIDGQKRAFDHEFWLQRFTRRGPKSGWSKINTKHAERLIQSKKMKVSGLRQIEEAKKDGRWHAAYDSARTANIPEDFLKLIERDKKAHAFFKTLDKTNLYSISYRLQTAKKPETREKRMKAIIEMLSRGEKFH